MADRYSRRPPAEGAVDIAELRPSVARLIQVVATVGAHVLVSVVRSRGRRPRAAAVQGAGEAFRRLGPTFVKLGQMISANPIIFPPAVIEAFSQCQDQVPAEEFSIARRTVVEDLDRPVHDVFKWIDPEPIASASIAQVHRANLADGTPVVVKIQRPGLARLLARDLAILELAARTLVRVRPRYGVANPVGVVRDFRSTLSEELSFKVEAGWMEHLQKVFADWPVAIAAVHHEATTDRLLTMDLMEGIKINDLPALDAAGHDRKAVAELLISSLLSSALQGGTFHGDGHPGNLVVLPDGRLGIYDFGIVGQLTDGDRREVSRFFRGLILSRFDVMAQALTQLADLSNADLDGATKDMMAMQSQLFGADGTFKLTEIDHAGLLGTFLEIANKHGMIIPTDLVLLFKQLLYLNGLANLLDPDLDVFEGERFFPFFATDDGWCDDAEVP